MEVYVLNTEFKNKKEIFIFEGKLVGLRGKIKKILFEKFHFDEQEELDDVANELVRKGESFGIDRSFTDFDDAYEHYILTKQEIL